MANASEFAGVGSPALQTQAQTQGTATAKMASLGLIICVGLAGNGALSLLVLRDPRLHKAPYLFLLDLCVADVLRSAVCLPFAMASLRSGTSGPASPLCCRLVAFLSALLCFHVALLLLCVSVTRYLAVAHHRFYSKRVTRRRASGAVVCAAWTLSAAMALPPVLRVGTYGFIRGEEQCTLEHRHLRENDSLGSLLALMLVVGATHAVYLKMLCFVHDHRKMRPAQLVPAVSHNWTFHGPGATGQAAANWIAGFGRGPTPPTLVGVRPVTHSGTARGLLVLDAFKAEKRLGRMYYLISLAFLVLWGPYLSACYVRVFARGVAVPPGVLTAATWMTFLQAGVNPVISVAFNKELRVRLRARFPRWLGTQTPMEPYCVI